MLDATWLATTLRHAECGQATWRRKVTDKRGKVHEIEVSVYVWQVLLLIETRISIPLAVKVVKVYEPEVL
jgi:hypothetical protein